MARGPREPEQATQAKPQHRGAPLETFHPFLQVPGRVWRLFQDF